jgi:hypothetical protein
VALPAADGQPVPFMRQLGQHVDPLVPEVAVTPVGG